MKLVSTVALGRGAIGTVSFLAASQGQRMHFLGNIPVDKVPKHNDSTTSVVKAGEFGTAVGALHLKSVRVSAYRPGFAEDDTPVRLPFPSIAGGIEYLAGGESVLKGALLELYKEVPISLDLKSTDAFDVWLQLDKELELKAKDFEMNEKQFAKAHPYVLLQVEFEAGSA